MAEGIALAVPFNEKEPTTNMRFASLFIQRYSIDPNGTPAEIPVVRVTLVGDEGHTKTYTWGGDEAKTMLTNLNTADLRTNSLAARVLAKVQERDAAMAGTATDLPDDPAT